MTARETCGNRSVSESMQYLTNTFAAAASIDKQIIWQFVVKLPTFIVKIGVGADFT